MNTDELINALAADTKRRALALSSAWAVALPLAVAVAAAVFFATLGPRPDIAAAAETARFLLKFVLAISLAVSAFVLAYPLSAPDGSWRAALPYLALPPLLLGVAVLVELWLVPRGLWWSTLVGTNSVACLTFIPLIGLGPLALFLLVLRHGAPTRPALAGAIAGLLAGGIAAAFYAAHCTDDSPLFVATWYTIAIAGLVGLGAVAAGRLARW